MSGIFTSAAEREGPFLTSALLCERVLQEQDGTLSVIRAVDMITVTPVGEPIPEDAKAVMSPLRLFLLLSFKGGVLGSKHEVTITGYSPSGAMEKFPTATAELATTVPGVPPGFNIIVQVQAAWQTAGVYWFEVSLDGRRATAVPLRVLHAPPEPLPLAPSEPGPGEQGNAPKT